jgi:hypothetical protein
MMTMIVVWPIYRLLVIFLRFQAAVNITFSVNKWSV